jgi:hypothetical protein
MQALSSAPKTVAGMNNNIIAKPLQIKTLPIDFICSSSSFFYTQNLLPVYFLDN